MDAVKAKSTTTVQAAEAPKRTQAPQRVKAEDKPAPKPEAIAMKKVAYEQPKPTTNTRGEKLGQHLNEVA